MKKIIAILLCAAMILSLTACGDSAQNNGSTGEASTEESTAAETSGTTTEGTSDGQALNVCLASEPQTLDPALNSAVDGATLISHMFSGLAKWEKDDSGALEIVPDCAEELPDGVENADGTV
ncbi:MAG TPA: peptide ABC transporter substrate-binding protein, partial [Lachnospiraceae bacterium]|nr:peptide ABC transporter substrate-binding protein [Lachnospiraceae bacterium]